MIRERGRRDLENGGTLGAKRVGFNYCFCLRIFTEEELQEIEDTKAHLAYEIHLSWLELEEAMVIAMVSVAFPFQLLASYIFSRFTNRNFQIRATSFFDMFIFAVVLVWFEKFEEYMYAENMGFGLTVPPAQEHIFMQQLLEDNRTGDFHFDWLLAACAFGFWLRMLFMLVLTNTFGPLIIITIRMMKDMSVFFVLFLIELVAFACVGILSFGNLKEYDNLAVALVMFFESSLGQFDMKIYDNAGSDAKRWFGVVFHITVLIVNMLLLLNLVIAIMSDTFARYSDVMLGLFSQGIV